MITIDGYIIDVAVREDHSFDNEVTEHPVEVGSDIVDHVRAKPIMLTLEGIVSDTPIGGVADLRSETTLPSREAFERLLAIRNARLPVTISTSLRVYTDMVLEALSTPREAKTGDALVFTARFRQVRIIENVRSTVVVEARNKGKVNRGNKPVVKKEIPESERESALYKMGSGLTSLFKD
jgi:hypothetical protein